MLSRLIFVVLALPVLILAIPSPQGSSRCDTGALNCCSTITTPQEYKQSAAPGGLIAQLLGTVEGTIGLSCNPITGIGASGNDCSAQPACCTGDTFNGLVTVGCTPVNVNV